MSAAVFKQTIERAGLSVPEDVLLTGFSDMPIARLMTLPLTTGTEDVAPPIFLTYYTFSKGVSLDFPSFSLLAMFGSFLWVVHNSPATLAADEIRVQKRRAVSDAPEAWIWGCCFMDFSLVCYLKTLPALARQGRAKIKKTAA